MSDSVNSVFFPEGAASYKDSKIVIVPVPYDKTSTWIKGSEKGPDAILQASDTLELYDIETGCEVYRMGINTTCPVTESSNAKKLVDAVKNRITMLIEDGKFPVVIGGNHSVSIGAIMAQCENFEDITILQFDAHTDLREEYQGSEYNHACVMARARSAAEIVQVGIRSMDKSEKKSINPERIFYAHNMIRNEDHKHRILEQLSSNVYITIDLDVFDPSIMPSTGTPEPGGLGWYQVMDILQIIAQNRKITGFDVVELCPNTNNRGPDYLAAKLIYKLLAYIFKDKC